MPAARSRVALVVCHADTHFCVAKCACLVVVVWGRVSEVADVHELAKIQHEVVAEHGHCVVLTIIRAGQSMVVKDGVREAGEDNIREFATTNRGSALIVESGGFRMVFFRTLLTSVQLVSRSPVKQKVFDNIDDGVRWLLGRPGVDPTLMHDANAIIASVIGCADTYGQPV